MLGMLFLLVKPILALQGQSSHTAVESSTPVAAESNFHLRWHQHGPVMGAFVKEHVEMSC